MKLCNNKNPSKISVLRLSEKKLLDLVYVFDYFNPNRLSNINDYVIEHI